MKAASAKTVKIRGPAPKVDQVMKLIAAKQSNRSGIPYEMMKSGDGMLSNARYFLTTGITSFDVGTGGLPIGRIIEIFGLEGSGKTAMVWRACVRGHEHCIFEKIQDPKTKAVSWKQVEDCDVFIQYFDNEQSLDESERLVVDGVEIEDAVVGRCDTVEDLFMAVHDFIKSTSQVMAKYKGRRYFNIIVVDTLASTSNKKEMTAKWDDVDFPRKPQQIQKAMRRLTRLVNTTNTLVVITNQANADFNAAQKKGGRGGIDPDKFISPGGRAVKFFASLRVFLHVLNSNYKLRKNAVGGPHGFVTKFTVVKNRQIRPWRTGRFVLLYDRGISDVFSKLETLVQLKLVERMETGSYRFRLKAAGITLETFKNADDEVERSDPRISFPGEWPAFYEAHKPEMDRLWDLGVKLMFDDSQSPLTEEDEDLLDESASELDESE